MAPMNSEQIPASPAVSASGGTPLTSPQTMTQREKSLGTAKALGVILIVLGIANAVIGVIIGVQITQPGHDFLGNVSGTEVSPTGIAFIGNAVAVGLILVLVGGVVVAFANALKPGAQNLPDAS